MLYSKKSLHKLVKYSLLSVSSLALLFTFQANMNNINASGINQQGADLTNQISNNILHTYLTGKANTKRYPYLSHSMRKQISHQKHISKRVVHNIRTTAYNANEHISKNWFTAGLNKKNYNARKRVAFLESSYNWNANNGECYGRYQLLPLYLGYTNGHVNLNHKHQVQVANAYVAKRYGNWQNALKFHLQKGYY